MHKRCSGIRGKLKKDSKFKCQTCANQERNRHSRGLSKHKNDQSLEILKKFCYFSDKIGATGVSFDSVIARIRSG